jgi:hypothetical protein
VTVTVTTVPVLTSVKTSYDWATKENTVIDATHDLARGIGDHYTVNKSGIHDTVPKK